MERPIDTALYRLATVVHQWLILGCAPCRIDRCHRWPISCATDGSTVPRSEWLRSYVYLPVLPSAVHGGVLLGALELERLFGRRHFAADPVDAPLFRDAWKRARDALLPQLGCAAAMHHCGFERSLPALAPTRGRASAHHGLFGSSRTVW